MYVELFGLTMKGCWDCWVEQKNPQENNAKMDKGEKDVEVVVHSCWFYKEISPHYLFLKNLRLTTWRMRSLR